MSDHEYEPDDEDDDDEKAAKAIGQWLTRLDKLMPSDGTLTDEVLALAGGLPLVVDEVDTEGLSAEDVAEERCLNVAEAVAFLQGYAGRNLEISATEARVKSYRLKDRKPAKAAELALRADYLTSIGNYIASLE